MVQIRCYTSVHSAHILYALIFTWGVPGITLPYITIELRYIVQVALLDSESATLGVARSAPFARSSHKGVLLYGFCVNTVTVDEVYTLGSKCVNMYSVLPPRHSAMKDWFPNWSRGKDALESHRWD